MPFLQSSFLVNLCQISTSLYSLILCKHIIVKPLLSLLHTRPPFSLRPSHCWIMCKCDVFYWFDNRLMCLHWAPYIEWHVMLLSSYCWRNAQWSVYWMVKFLVHHYNSLHNTLTGSLSNGIVYGLWCGFLNQSAHWLVHVSWCDELLLRCVETFFEGLHWKLWMLCIWTSFWWSKTENICVLKHIWVDC